MNVYNKSFDELSNDEMYKIMKARTDIFVVEQQCPYPELDNLDQHSRHLFFSIDHNIVAYVRIIPKGIKYREAAAIGRVLVVENYRGKGYAKDIMEQAITYIFEVLNESSIKIQAQVYLEEFYQSLGFVKTSREYDEDGIPHIDMLLKRK